MSLRAACRWLRCRLWTAHRPLPALRSRLHCSCRLQSRCRLPRLPCDSSSSSYSSTSGVRHGSPAQPWRRRRADDGQQAAAAASSRAALGEYLYGFHPAMAALTAGRRRIHRAFLLLSDSGSPADSSASSSVRQLLWSQHPSVSVQELSRQQLNLLSGDRPHNGVVLDVSPLPLADCERLPEPLPDATRPPPVWLLLDSLSDPHNLGAILRSAAFFSAAGVVVCSKNVAPLSAVASKASSGAMEWMDIRSCSHSTRLIRRSNQQQQRSWRVIGLQAAEEAGSSSSSSSSGSSGSSASACASASDCRSFQLDSPTLVVIGNEASGIRPQLRAACSQLLSIASMRSDGSSAAPSSPRPLLDSLNVSNAVAVLLYQCSASWAAQQQRQPPKTGRGEAQALQPI